MFDAILGFSLSGPLISLWCRVARGGKTMKDEPTRMHEIEGIAVPQDRDKAEQVASMILEATRADVGVLRAEMTGIRSVVTAIQAELTLLANKADVLRAHADLQARMERVQKWLQIGFGVFAGLLAALVIAALRYLPAIGHG